VSVTGTSVFTWVVYESTSYTGAFSKVFEQTNSNTGSATFVSSGALSVPLTPGKFYLLGVIVQGAFTGYFNYPTSKQFVSFGQVWNGAQLIQSSAAASISVVASSINVYQRVSTSK